MKYLLIILLLFNLTAKAQYAGTYASANVDKSANNYIDSAGFTGSTNGRTYRFIFTRLAKDLKGFSNANYTVSNSWDSLTGFYPLSGATLTKAAWNFKNPTIYKITFFNSPTAKDSGIIYNGVDQYGTTGIQFFNGQKTYHIAIYGLRNSTGGFDIGYYRNSPYNQLGIYMRYPSDSKTYFEYAGGGELGSTFSTTTGLGLFAQSSNGNNQCAYRGTTQLGSSTTTVTGAVSGYNIDLNPNTTGVTHGGNNIGAASIGGYLTSTQITGLYNSIQSFKQRLGVSVGTAITID
ncbi:MAG: hypothetical protein JSR11_03550 [Bacteroidetes bacterium]|nr:hypothetical protein [Bacteroidota bacterium]